MKSYFLILVLLFSCLLPINAITVQETLFDFTVNCEDHDTSDDGITLSYTESTSCTASLYNFDERLIGTKLKIGEDATLANLPDGSGEKYIGSIIPQQFKKSFPIVKNKKITFKFILKASKEAGEYFLREGGYTDYTTTRFYSQFTGKNNITNFGDRIIYNNDFDVRYYTGVREIWESLHGPS